MDISSIINDGRDDSQGISTIPTDITNDSGSGNQLDPLTNFAVDDNGKKLEFNANETINTSDNSSVGDYTAVKATSQDNSIRMALSDQSTTTEPTVAATNEEYVVTDPAKMDFIKTYTREYDDLVSSATHAVELILNSIDKTVQEHTEDIAIPEEAMSFLDNKPENGKVSKFDEAQQIVRTIMGKANDAKQQGEQAAKEAARVYDGIQQFKQDTRREIDQIRNRDEFGQTRDGGSLSDDGALPTISR